MAVASTMRVFRACPVPDVGSLGGLPRIEFSQSPEGPDSLAAGKNAGNFFDSAVFCENLSRKQLRIQLFADEFPTRTGQVFFCQRRELIRRAGNGREFRRKNRSARPDAS